MSKKCCGIIYSDEEQVCRMCGKQLGSEETSADLSDTEKTDIEKTNTEKTDTVRVDNIEDIPSNEKLELESESDASYETEEVELGDAPTVVLVDENALDGDAETDVLVGNDRKKNPEESHSEAEAAESEMKETKVAEAEMANTETAQEENSDSEPEEPAKKQKASVGLKVFGTFLILLSIVGVGFIALLLYTLVLQPRYFKDGMADKEFVFTEISTTTDAIMDTRKELLVGNDASATDATPIVEETEADAANTDLATNLDATE